MSIDPARLKKYLAFALLYFFWGSTYLAIAIAVKHLPPALMTGLRFIIAGPLMLAWCVLTRRSIRLSRPAFTRLLLISILLLTCGNMLLVWAEQYIPSGLASLFVAVVPIQIAFVEGFLLRGDRLTGQGWGGIILGSGGLLLLLWPKLENPSGFARAQLIACFCVMLGSFCWACGSILSRRSRTGVDAFSATAWEMTFAGIINLTLAAAFGDYVRADWSRSGLLAVFYLVVFGSWVGFTAYIWLLERVPTAKVATYAYVNPIVAVFLGYMIAQERLDRFSVAGMVVIIAAVVLVTRAKLIRGGQQGGQDEVLCPPCENEA